MAFKTNEEGLIINTTTGKIIAIERAKVAAADLLMALGEDIYREGLQDTPRRIANYWVEMLSYDEGKTDTQFSAGDAVGQMVWVKDHHFVSHCEHHLALIRGKVTVAYITTEKVLGLSKIPRIIEKYAHALTLQEKMGTDIADHICSMITPEGIVDSVENPPSVAVYIEASHACMQCRGIKSDGIMITNALRGAFLTEPAVRAEFMSVCMAPYR